MKNKLLVSTIVLATLAPMVQGAMAAETANTDSKVKATVKSGGMTLEADTVNLGKLEIGKKINNVDGEVRVTDYTGGEGWDLSVKSTNYDKVNPSLVESVQVGDGEKSLLLPNDTKVDNGPSLLETQKRKATYSAEWGVAPVAGGVNNELTWTLTPFVDEANDILAVTVNSKMPLFTEIRYRESDESSDDILMNDEMYLNKFYKSTRPGFYMDMPEVDEGHTIEMKKGEVTKVDSFTYSNDSADFVNFVHQDYGTGEEVRDKLLQNVNPDNNFLQNTKNSSDPISITVANTSEAVLEKVDGAAHFQKGKVTPEGTTYEIYLIDDIIPNHEFVKTEGSIIWQDYPQEWDRENYDGEHVFVDANGVDTYYSYESKAKKNSLTLHFSNGETRELELTTKVYGPKVASSSHFVIG